MSKINIQGLRKSFTDLSNHVKLKLGEIEGVKLIHEKYGESLVDVNDRVYGLFFDLYDDLSSDLKIREGLFLLCESEEERLVVQENVNGVNSVLGNLSKNMNKICLAHLNYFDTFLKISGKEYAQKYLSEGH
ncbi:MAG: hypothetical protein Q8L27_00995 [archaeon]|nr:hypothetical protein [archaeon]